MTAKRSRRRQRPTHSWWQVRSGVRCALGAHLVAAGEWVRTRIGDYYRLASCEACLKASGIERPHRPFTFAADVAEDVKTRQTGGDE